MSVKHLRRPVPPDAEFSLPVQGLYADFEAGTGAVWLDDEFRAANPIVQLRILKDWGSDIAKLQAAAAKELFIDFGHADLPRSERLSKFARHCSWLGIEVPPALLATF